MANLSIDWKGVRGALGFEIFAFPVAVTVVSAAALMCGTTIGPWIWFFSFAGTLLLGMRGIKGMYSILATAAISAAFLAFCRILTASPVFLQDFDASICHIPAVRLLADGWNPVYESTPESISAAFGIDSSTMRIWHLLAMPKAVWYFNAAAYFATGNEYSMMLPILPFMGAALAVSVWRFLKASPAAGRIAAILPVFYIMPFRCNFFVTDNVVAIAGTGFLLALVRLLRGEELHENGLGLEMFAWAFWMAASKPAGIFHIILWCVIFGMFAKARMQHLPKAKHLLLFAAFLAICWASPYYSMWREYGHPFYPALTQDAAKHPAIDLTEDFYDRNEDAASLNWPERFVYSWISPDAVKWYRAKFRNEPDFQPYTWVWGKDTSGRMPTRPHTRLMLWAMALFLAAAGRKGSVPAILCIFAGLVAMPPKYMGYLRYTPWLHAPLAVLSIERILESRFRTAAAYSMLALATGAFALRAKVFAKAYTAKEEIDGILRKNPRLRVYSRHPGTNNDWALYELRRRHIPEWRNVQIMPGVPEDDPRFEIFTDGSCYVEKGTVPLQ